MLLITDSNNVDTHEVRRESPLLPSKIPLFTGNHGYQIRVFFWTLFSAFTFFYNFLNYVEHGPLSVAYAYTYTHPLKWSIMLYLSIFPLTGIRLKVLGLLIVALNSFILF